MFSRQPLTCFQIKMPIVQGMSPMQRTPLWTTPQIHRRAATLRRRCSLILGMAGSDTVSPTAPTLVMVGMTSMKLQLHLAVAQIAGPSPRERSILEIEIVVATHHTSVGIIRLTLCPPRSASAMTMMPTRILHIYHKQVHQKFTSLRLSMQML